MTTHEVLVAARIGAAADAYNVHSFGIWENDDCGTPRCMLGWCAWESGIRIPAGLTAEPLRELDADTPKVYKDAVRALWDARPYEPELAAPGEVLFAVEDVASRIEEESEGNRAKERAEVLAWFDRAIAATAPVPDTSFLTEAHEEVPA